MEIARRLTGISTPFVGISWNPPPDSETSTARRLIDYLEDRRVLFAPYDREVPQYTAESVLEIRKRLSTDIERYVEFCGHAMRSRDDLKRVAPKQMERYAAIRRQVLDLLREADELAKEIRSAAAGSHPSPPSS
jgi:hypothetical protein